MIAELDTGWAVLGDNQSWPGYSLLIAKEPVTELHELAPRPRLRLLEELSQLAEAVHRVVRPHKLNYELLGNSVHHVHWHVFPRRLDEADPKSPVWGQMPTDAAAAAASKFDPAKHDFLRRAIGAELSAIREATVRAETR
jgi:diadenosine tetraphosphate (Ap4A) HIT family hydrolase